MGTDLFDFRDGDLRSIPRTHPSLVQRAGDGDRDALDELARQYRGPLVGFVRSKGVAMHDAEDVVQEVLVRAFAEREILRRVDFSKGRFRGLMVGVTRNVLREWWRKNPKRVNLDEGAIQGLARGEDRDADFDLAYARSLVEAALERLRSDDPAAHFVFDLRARGKSYREIAADYESRHGGKGKGAPLTREFIDNRLRRAKQIVRREVLRRLREEFPTEEEIRDELRQLAPYLVRAWPLPRATKGEPP